MRPCSAEGQLLIQSKARKVTDLRSDIICRIKKNKIPNSNRITKMLKSASTEENKGGSLAVTSMSQRKNRFGIVALIQSSDQIEARARVCLLFEGGIQEVQ